MRQNIKTKLQMIRKEINNDVEKYLKHGGEIKKCPSGVMAKREVSLRLTAEERRQKIKNGEAIQ